MSFIEYLKEKQLDESLTPDKIKLLVLIDDYTQKMYDIGNGEAQKKNVKSLEREANKMMENIKKYIEKM